MIWSTVYTEEQVRSLIRRYEAAFNANDAAAMNALFTVDATFVNFGGRLVVGRDDLLDAQRFVFDPGGALEQTSVRYEVERVVALSETIVAAHARQRSSDTDGQRVDGGHDPMQAVFTVILQHIDGEWRIRLGQNTPVT